MKKINFKGAIVIYYILFAVALALSLCLFLWDDAQKDYKDSIKYLIGGALIVYSAIFLAPNLFRRRKGIVKAYMIVEIALVVLMALGMVLSQLKIINVTECQAVGLTLWCRGFVEIIRGYYNQGDVRVAGKKSSYDHAAKYINIALITFGTYVFFNVFINKDKLLFVSAVAFAVAAGIMLIFAIYCTKAKIDSKNGKVVQKESKDKTPMEKNEEEKAEKESEVVEF